MPADVKLVREPSNPYDANAIRAEVDRQLIGYLARHVAAQLAPALDGARCRSFGVCGVIRGGSYAAPNLGVHIWLEMLTTPGPEIRLTDDFGEVSWPPRGNEAFPLRGRATAALPDAELDARRIRGVHHMCLKDELSCPACRAADDDRLRRLDDPVRLANRPPHPHCTSVEGCRCMEFYVLVDESPPPQGWDWSNESLELNRLDGGEKASRG